MLSSASASGYGYDCVSMTLLVLSATIKIKRSHAASATRANTSLLIIAVCCPHAHVSTRFSRADRSIVCSRESSFPGPPALASAPSTAFDHNAARQPQKRLGISGLSIDARIRTHELIATSLMRTSHHQRNLPSWTRTASPRQRLGQSPHRSSGAALKSSSARWILLKVCFLHSYSGRRLVMYEFDPVSFSF